MCYLRSKTLLTSVDCLCGPPRPIQRGRWTPRVLCWLALISPSCSDSPAGSARGGVGGRRGGSGRAALRAARAGEACAEAEEPHGAARRRQSRGGRRSARRRWRARAPPRARAVRIVGAVGELQPRRGQRAARRGPERLPELWRHRADPRWWPRL